MYNIYRFNNSRNTLSKGDIMRKSFVAILVLIVALLEGCAVVPTPVYRGQVVVTTTGGLHHYPGVYHPSHHYYNNKVRDSRIDIEEDEHGLKSFRVNQSGLMEREADWLLSRFESLKSECQNGGVMKRFQKRMREHADPYAPSRVGRGDTSLNLEYVCNRDGSMKPAPRSRP